MLRLVLSVIVPSAVLTSQREGDNASRVDRSGHVQDAGTSLH
jgi:hypothetical protein